MSLLATAALSAMLIAGDEHHHHHHAAPAEATAASEAAVGRSLYALDGTWTTDENRVMRLDDLRGAPVFLTMAYTSCKDVCPLLMEDLRRLQRKLSPAERSRARFVIVTLDPARDTPAKLAAFKKKLPDAAPWTFLRGSAEQVLILANVLGVKYRPDGADIVHTTKIVLLDAGGEVRAEAAGLGAGLDDLLRAFHDLPRSQPNQETP